MTSKPNAPYHSAFFDRFCSTPLAIVSKSRSKLSAAIRTIIAAITIPVTPLLTSVRKPGTKSDKISSRTMMEKILEHDPKKNVYYFEEFEDIANFVYKNAKDGDLVLTMGAGDIYKVGELILDMDVSRIEAIRKTKTREIQKIED